MSTTAKLLVERSPTALRDLQAAVGAVEVLDMAKHLDAVLMADLVVERALTYTLPGGVEVRWTLKLQRVGADG